MYGAPVEGAAFGVTGEEVEAERLSVTFFEVEVDSALFSSFLLELKLDVLPEAALVEPPVELFKSSFLDSFFSSL